MTTTTTHRDPHTVSLIDLDDRIVELENWPRSLGDALSRDPRCGCEEDGEGARCDWDDINTLEHVYAVRMAGAA